MNDLNHLRRVWQTLGRDDPLWAVLSHADKRGGRWDPEEFFATGRAEIDTQMHLLAARRWPAGRALALDFGCGAGRLSRALAAHFEQVIGVDVSASMIDTARSLNRDVANVEFRENPSPRIENVADASVDLVYSSITLQHIPAALAKGYVAEFFRIPDRPSRGPYPNRILTAVNPASTYPRAILASRSRSRSAYRALAYARIRS